MKKKLSIFIFPQGAKKSFVGNNPEVTKGDALYTLPFLI